MVQPFHDKYHDFSLFFLFERIFFTVHSILVMVAALKTWRTAVLGFLSAPRAYHRRIYVQWTWAWLFPLCTQCRASDSGYPGTARLSLKHGPPAHADITASCFVILVTRRETAGMRARVFAKNRARLATGREAGFTQPRERRRGYQSP